MNVINNFLNVNELVVFETLIDECTEKVQGVPYNDDDAIKGFDNSYYTNPTKEFRNWWINLLKHKNMIAEEFDECDIVSLQIVEAKYPYHALWHKDSFEHMPLGSVLYYFGDDWDAYDGGLFITKDNENDNNGTWVAPTTNTCIFNPHDVYHAVTPYINQDKTRRAVFMFLHRKDFK